MLNKSNLPAMKAAKEKSYKMLKQSASLLLKWQDNCIERLQKVDPKASMKLSEGFKSPYGTSLVDLYMKRAIGKGHTVEEATKIGLEIFFAQKQISPKIKDICFEDGF